MRNIPIGFIFDWDGVVINSSILHEKSWELLSREVGMPLPTNHFKQGFGKKNTHIIPAILGWTKNPDQVAQLSKRKEEIYRELGKKDGLELVDGIIDFLEEMHTNEIPAAIGTSTDRHNLELAFEQHPIKKFFCGSVCGEDVTQGKPEPEVFLKAASLIKIKPEQCVVFEDSPHGIDAALNGKMKAIGFSTSQPAEVLSSHGAHMVVKSPVELTITKVLNLY